jgi:hypothetical protein
MRTPTVLVLNNGESPVRFYGGMYRANLCHENNVPGVVVHFCSESLAALIGGLSTRHSVTRTPINQPQSVAGGTALLPSNFTINGWGDGASLTVSGNDANHVLTITAGETPSVNPTIGLIFGDGAWTLAPLVVGQIAGGTGDVDSDSTETAYTLTFKSLPVIGETFTFNVFISTAEI